VVTTYSPLTHSDRFKLGDDEYVTGKYPAEEQ
jgi:hypothetical protein